MRGDRVQRQIERLLDEAEQAISQRDWAAVREAAQAVLRVDPENLDARSYLAMAGDSTEIPPIRTPSASGSQPAAQAVAHSAAESTPTAFANGRYAVQKFLGEGGKKQVYLAHDSLLDREVAFALIKTEGLDEVGRERIRREAQAMGRLGAHPHIVSVFDLGDHEGQPYIVTELMGGGDVEGLIAEAPEHRVSLETALRVADEVCQGLEYAHSHSIVHRDLKPGNVWLTGDGRAKLGDFGLAVATDRSRLTQAGLMVGTVSYMPPEQALGGEVTPRSDLYSLGAMLYELVTGRPPFVGDESVAIITQHLNTPPVSPSWHVPGLPPGLETLILRLLEKDPARRPASASEVSESLAAIHSDPLRSLDTHATETAPRQQDLGAGERATASPVYRRVFVGREAELRQLENAFDQALSGHGLLMMVVGEPGIGKTALCEQLATYVAMRGGRTLVGHSYEEGSLSLPYLPFVEALRSYVLTREPEGLRQDLGSGAAEVARIVSEVRDRVPVDLQAVGDPDEERWRLLQAVSGFLANASHVQPLLIILEDLHWADRGTLDLLVYLVRQLSGTRLLLVGNYRDVEVDRTHPLASALAELRRASSFARIPLRGLTSDEVQRMLSTIAGQEVSWSLAEAVHRQTEGNPLFVQEVMRYLVEEGLLTRDEVGGRWRRSGSLPAEEAIPEGLREVIGKRLSRLGPTCNRLLAVASVIGREFRLETLRTLALLSEEQLLEALEEAVRVGVLEEEAHVGQVRYRFTHAFFRQTLYEELSAPRRIQLHQQVARALEQQYAARLEEHAAELAEHFSHSSDHADLGKAVHYGTLAAQRAIAVHAYGEAVRHLERALEVQEVLDPRDQSTRCDLLLALAEALGPAGEPRRVFEQVAGEAFALAEALGDRQLAMHACRLGLDCINRYAATMLNGAPVHQTWAERADHLAQPGTAERALADAALAASAAARGEWSRLAVLAARALQAARESGDAQALLDAANRTLGSSTWKVEEFPTIVRLAHQAIDQLPEGVSTLSQARALQLAARNLLRAGELPAAEGVRQRLQVLAELTRDPRVQQVRLEFDITWFILDGDLSAALEATDQVVALGDEAGSPVRARARAATFAESVLNYLGRAEEAVRGYDELIAATGLAAPHVNRWAAFRRYACAAAATSDPVALSWLQADLLRDLSLLDELPALRLLEMLEAELLLGDREALATLLLCLEPLSGMPVQDEELRPLGRYLGDAAALLGDRGRARRLYDAALEATAGLRFRPEMAVLHLRLAELLREGSPDEEREAQPHLDIAIGEFRAMQMQSYLERALSHKGLLHA